VEIQSFEAAFDLAQSQREEAAARLSQDPHGPAGLEILWNRKAFLKVV